MHSHTSPCMQTVSPQVPCLVVCQHASRWQHRRMQQKAHINRPAAQRAWCPSHMTVSASAQAEPSSTIKDHGLEHAAAHHKGTTMTGTHNQPQSQIDLTALYTRQLYSPEKCVGMVQAVLVPGCGVGLVATEDMRTGDLVMAVPSLAIVYGPEGAMPATEAVVEQLFAQQPLEQYQLRWLQLLRMDRAGGAAGAAKTGSQDLPGQGKGPLTLQQQCEELQALLSGTWSPPSDQGSGFQQAVSNNGHALELLSEGGQPVTGNVHARPADLHEAGKALQGAGSESAAATPVHQALPGSRSEADSMVRSGPSVNAEQLARAVQSGDVYISGAAGGGAGLSTGDGALQLTRDGVLEAVACNVVGEVREDVGACALRQQEPRQAYCGLWPEFALLNHSCAPNTVHVMVGGMLLVRAARPVLAGEELTTCYLGAARWQHVAARRTFLRQHWGFLCGCERCVLEQRLFPTVRYPNGAAGGAGGRYRGAGASGRRRGGMGSGAVQWVLDRVFGEGRYMLGVSPDPGLLQRTNRAVAQQWEPDVQDALAASPQGAMRRREAVKAALTKAVEEVDSAIKALDLEPREALLLQASVYLLHILRAELLQLVPELAEGGEEVAALERCCRIMETGARGSDTHLYLALATSSRAAKHYGRQAAEARMEQLSASSAHVARYGPVELAVLKELMEVRRADAIASWLGQRLGVLAWDSNPTNGSDGA